jgi:hypothetical protein
VIGEFKDLDLETRTMDVGSGAEGLSSMPVEGKAKSKNSRYSASL